MRCRKGNSAGGVVTEPPAGGLAAYKNGGKSGFRSQLIEGSQGPRRHDRPGRRYGGRIGSDSAPLSQAADTTQPKFKN